MLTITQRAAEAIAQSAANDKELSNLPLRISARKGALGKISYNMGFDELTNGDMLYESNGVKVLLDMKSQALVNGMTVDFTTSLKGTQPEFVFINPNAVSGGSCSCGDQEKSDGCESCEE